MTTPLRTWSLFSLKRLENVLLRLGLAADKKRERRKKLKDILGLMIFEYINELKSNIDQETKRYIGTGILHDGFKKN